MKELEKKILNVVSFLLQLKAEPKMIVNSVNEIEIDDIRKLKEQGFKAIILDVDQTLRKYKRKIPKENQEWLQKLKKELKIIVVSNGYDKNIKLFFDENGIPYIGYAAKPLRKNFLLACEMLNVKPEEVVVIGNSLVTDVYGGKRNNMKTIKVKGVICGNER